jgi:hypothetical protein
VANTTGGVITLSGRNFASRTNSGARVANVTVGGGVCPIITSTDANLTCTAPAGVGNPVSVALVVDGQAAVSANTSFGYSAPVIQSVSGCVNNVPAGTTAECSAGVPITLVGYNFGTSGANVTVSTNLTCAPVVVVTAHTSVTCTLPAGVGLGLSVTLTVGGQSGTRAAALSFTGPMITAGTLRLAGGTAGTAVTLPDAQGGQRVQFVGKYMGNAVSVTYGPASNPGQYTCATKPTCAACSSSNSTFVDCQVSTGVGAGLVFRVFDPATSQFSQLGTDTLSYPAPVYVRSNARAACVWGMRSLIARAVQINSTLRKAGVATGSSAYNAAQSAGESISFDVLFAGPSSSARLVAGRLRL